MNAISWLIAGLILVAAYIWYASIVRRKIRVSEALAGIDVQLQQRHDLIPNVLTIAKRFMEHERGLLNDITELRAKAHQQVGERDFAKVAEKFETEARLGQQMGRLLMLAENYPQLKADGPMKRSGPTPRSRPTSPPRAASTTPPSPHSAAPCRRFQATC
jgi:LemA protein